MSDIAIRVEGLSKVYRIGERERYYTLRDSLARSFTVPFRSFRNGRQPAAVDCPSPANHSSRPAHGNAQFVWALKDVSFEVKQGEVVGVIGRNGAGKSTLLKILAEITEPTTGWAEIRGRVRSLLEVGTGFHPELTGRENIYLNGAILGMKKTEINHKFDEIVSFAEIERFLDTPVKHYSSGMYMRLAFSVAAHLEPEILLVDEVLAVGDTAFQKKCLGRMGDVAKQGRTVIFVSHNMAAVRSLCAVGILLDCGEVKTIDDADEVVRDYLAATIENGCCIDLASHKFRRGTQEVKFEWAQLHNSEQRAWRKFSVGDDITIVFSTKSNENHLNQRVKLAVQIRTSDGIQLCNIVDVDSKFQVERLKQKEVFAVCIRDIRLYPDTYYVSLWVGSVTSTETFDHVEDCLSFEILDGGRLTVRSLPRSAGLLFLTPEWKVLQE